MSKIYELVRPMSLIDSAYEEFEYLIRWIGRDGSEYLWMFYDAEIRHNVKNEVVNSDSETNIKALIDSESRRISLTANDLTKIELQVIGEMFSNDFVYRILKSSNVERYAPDANSFRYRLMDLKYEIDFDLIMPDMAVIR
jgi:hypothetical protein